MPQDIDLIIYGGGALPDFPEVYRRAFFNAKVVAWGVGITSPKLEKVNNSIHYETQKKFDLYSSRDYGATDNYVPCVSCMSQEFNKKTKTIYEYVCYGHSGKMPLKEQALELKIPYNDNSSFNNLHDVINFLSSGNHIITSSYHGAYWGTLLGKKVSIIPFGSKFFNFKYQPNTFENLKSALSNGLSFDGCLEEARYLNKKFFKSILDVAF